MNEEPVTVYGWLLANPKKPTRALVMVSESGASWTATVDPSPTGIGFTVGIDTRELRNMTPVDALAMAQQQTDWWVEQGYEADSEMLAVTVPDDKLRAFAREASEKWIGQRFPYTAL